MAYRTPEEQAAIEARKYRAWNELKSGVRGALTPAAEALGGAMVRPGVNLATALGPNLPRLDFRAPGAEYTPERTAQIAQDFRSSLPGRDAGKPTFQDRRPKRVPGPSGPGAAAQPGALDALFQQSPLAGPRELTPEGVVPRRRWVPQATAAPQAVNALAAGTPAPPPERRIGGDRLQPGQGWAQFENGPRYDIDQGPVRKFGPAGAEQPMRGTDNVLTPEETRNLFGPRGGAAAPGAYAAPSGPPDYDPDRLAAAQFTRIKSAADALVAEAHNSTFDDVRAAKYAAAQHLYDQLGAANNAGLAAGGGIAQEGVRGRSDLAQQQLQNQGDVEEQQARNAGAYGVQGLQGRQAVDIERLKNEGLSDRERLIGERETAQRQAEREDKRAERMGLTSYDPQTGLPIGEVPANKYVYGQDQVRPTFEVGKTYRHRDGSQYRYNGGDIDDPKSWSRL